MSSSNPAVSQSWSAAGPRSECQVRDAWTRGCARNRHHGGGIAGFKLCVALTALLGSVSLRCAATRCHKTSIR